MTANKKIIPSSLFLLLLIFLFNPVKVWGQQVPSSPDCGPVFINQAITTGTTIAIPSTAGKDNRTLGCESWVFAYQANATSGTFTNIDFQSANGAVSAGTFNSWPGTVNTGINPNTNQSTAVTTFSTGCVSMAECSVDNSWVRVLITRNNFVGTITGVLYGYKTGPIFNVIATVVPSGVQAVDGPTAAGSPPTTPPVLVAGQDGAPGNIQTIKTDTNGRQIVVGAAATGAAIAGNPVLVGGRDTGGNARPIATDLNGAQVVAVIAAGIDGEANGQQVHLLSGTGSQSGPLENFPSIFDGTTWNRSRSPSIVNDPPSTTNTGRNVIGAGLVEFGSRWGVNSSPATGSQGSASLASEVGVRHVMDMVCWSAQSSGGAVAATTLTITLRDGATGAGSELRTFQIAIPVAAGTGQQEAGPFCTPGGLGIVGTTNTAMTAEFSAGVANLNESISMSGYNVN